MNISKIIFKEKNYEIIAIKKYSYKVLNKIYFTFIEPKRYKKYYSYWQVTSKGQYDDNISEKKLYYFLTKYKDYECFNHKNELIKKDFNFYKYITIKDLKLNKGIKDLSLASKLVNELSMELLLK
jgi:hypothetical protein|tara:strand:+ start:334 stop:708 length:375 start_codon:yes stop_codon:yes gene_type:complete